MILNDKNKTIYFLLFLASLFFSFFYGENSSGGAKLDHAITKSYVDNFALGYNTGFKYFGNQIHSPFFYILLAETKKIFSPNILSIIYIFISSSIPIIFYLTLKKKFSRVNTNTLFALSLLIFFSPYFRSSAVWLTNDNLALLFFVLSINKYVHFTEVQNKKFQNFILCLFFLILASYIRQNYAIFSVFYFVKAFNIFSKKEVLYAFIYKCI